MKLYLNLKNGISEIEASETPVAGFDLYVVRKANGDYPCTVSFKTEGEADRYEAAALAKLGETAAPENAAPVSPPAGDPVWLEATEVVRRLGRMTTYGDGPGELEANSGNGEDAMRVLNHWILESRKIMDAKSAPVSPA